MYTQHYRCASTNKQTNIQISKHFAREVIIEGIQMRGRGGTLHRRIVAPEKVEKTNYEYTQNKRASLIPMLTRRTACRELNCQHTHVC